MKTHAFLVRIAVSARYLLVGLVGAFGTGSLPAAETPAPVPLFTRHVVPVLSRLGCNSGGACHGVVLGQNGFRLSLFGGQPARDFEYLTRENVGRRLSVLDPDLSLILLKATGQAPHGGGKRTEVGSSDYRILRDWIAAGARLDDVTKSRLTGLTVTPAEQVLKTGESGKLRVTATYSDGSSADVTHLCRYQAHDESVATADSAGVIQARGVGDTAIIVRCGAEPVLASVVVAPESRRPFPEIKPHTFIDEHILAKLQALDLVPSALCDDATFLRRLCLDVTWALPTPEEVRAFLADNDPEKRKKKIDEVLNRPGHAEVWALLFSDLIKPVERGNEGNNNIQQGQILRIRFYEWLRARLQENVPYDQLVERIFVSSTLEGRPVEQWLDERKAMREELTTMGKRPLNEPLLSAYNQRKTLDLYWGRDGAIGVGGAMQFAHAFLGLRLQCAQCHRHPYDVWQQDDLLSFANFFSVNTAGTSPQVEAYYNEQIKPGVQAWTDDLKLIGQSKEAADRTRAAQIQAKIAAAQSVLKAEVLPISGGPIGSASVRNSLGTQSSSSLRLLGEKSNAELAAGQDRRQLVMQWLRRPDHPFFAKAIVNRVWAQYLGRGLVDPPDNLSPLNPPSHSRLLDELSQGFVKSGYDLKWLHRTILQSRTYQQSHEAEGPSGQDRRNYTRFTLRRLPPEVILDNLNQAAGVKEKFNASWMFREGEKAILVAGVMVDTFAYQQINDPFRYLIMGRQLRRVTVQCDCEQNRDPTLPQLFFLANHPEVRQKIADEKGRVAQLASDTKLDDKQRVEELFLWALGRPPSADELETSLKYLKTSTTPRKGLEDVLWGLVNTREFQLNY